jgi:tRNA (mo5U34)-methyltransferase
MNTSNVTDPIDRRIAELGEWFHNLNLHGHFTAPNHYLGDYPSLKWQRFAHAVPLDLRGMSVLDVGCNAGFYAIEMKKRGAARVVGIDSDPVYLAQAAFAAETLGVDIDLRQLSVYDVAALDERFDIVLFMGVVYHLRYPLLALDLLHEHVTRDLFVFQSMLRGSTEVKRLERNYPFTETDIFDEPGYPKLHFVEYAYTGDETNWWIPNRAAAEAMLRSAGYQILDRPEDEVYVCRHVKDSEVTPAASAVAAGRAGVPAP